MGDAQYDDQGYYDENGNYVYWEQVGYYDDNGDFQYYDFSQQAEAVPEESPPTPPVSKLPPKPNAAPPPAAPPRPNDPPAPPPSSAPPSSAPNHSVSLSAYGLSDDSGSPATFALKSAGVIADGEKRFIDQHLQSKSLADQVVWMDWVKKVKRDKVQDRLLVVTRYRLISIARGSFGGKTIQREGHLLDLKEIFAAETDQAKFVFTRGVDGSKGPANGFIMTYIAMCNYYGSTPSAELPRVVEDLNTKGGKELDFAECAEIGTGGTFDLLPVSAALRHNTYFQAIVLNNVTRKDLVLRAAEFMQRNVTIKKISLVGIEAESGFIEFGEALRMNPGNILTEINFSKNKIGDRGIAGLAAGFVALTHTLTRLVLRECTLGSKGIQTLFEALEKNNRVSQSLVELDVSGNQMGKDGAAALVLWLQNMGAKSSFNLRRLVLQDTGCDIFGLMQAARIGILKTLIELDISGNKLDKAAAQAIAVALKEPESCLSRLTCGNCKLGGEALEMILAAMAANGNLKDVKVDFSYNDLSGSSGAAALCNTVSKCNNLHTLRLRGNAFKPESFAKVVDSIVLNNSIRRIDLSENMKQGKHTMPQCEALALLINRHPSLTSLSIAGDSKNFYTGPDIRPLIDALANNNKLRELDISHNRLGDQGATLLSDALRKNQCLQRIRWDDNGTTLGGWQAFKAMLQAGNTSLCEMAYPIADIEKALINSRDARLRDRINDCIHAIADVLRKNANAAGYSPERDVDDYSQYANVSVEATPPPAVAATSRPASTALGNTDSPRTSQQGPPPTPSRPPSEQSEPVRVSAPVYASNYNPAPAPPPTVNIAAAPGLTAPPSLATPPMLKLTTMRQSVAPPTVAIAAPLSLSKSAAIPRPQPPPPAAAPQTPPKGAKPPPPPRTDTPPPAAKQSGFDRAIQGGLALPGITKPPGRPPPPSGYSDRAVPPPPPPREGGDGAMDASQYGLTQPEMDDAVSQFKEADADGSGELSKDEIQSLMLNIMRGKMGEENIKRLTNLRFMAADADHSGKISQHEFLNMYGFIKKECENKRRLGKK